jgi:hypothetical protein
MAPGGVDRFLSVCTVIGSTGDVSDRACKLILIIAHDANVNRHAATGLARLNLLVQTVG